MRDINKESKQSAVSNRQASIKVSGRAKIEFWVLWGVLEAKKKLIRNNVCEIDFFTYKRVFYCFPSSSGRWVPNFFFKVALPSHNVVKCNKNVSRKEDMMF